MNYNLWIYIFFLFGTDESKLTASQKVHLKFWMDELSRKAAGHASN